VSENIVTEQTLHLWLNHHPKSEWHIRTNSKAVAVESATVFSISFINEM